MLHPTITTRFGQRLASFVVPVPDRAPVHMSFALRAHMNDHSAVVMVQAERFLELWRNEPNSIHREQSFGTAETWRRDYKFHHAEDGFSHGQGNPVPLAYVSFGIEPRVDESYRFLWFGRSTREVQVPYVGFTNGVTRTIWLLANQCAAFPVECELPGARELQELAGVPGSSLLTVASLLRSADAA
jgi:hypothetical protein